MRAATPRCRSRSPAPPGTSTRGTRRAAGAGWRARPATYPLTTLDSIDRCISMAVDLPLAPKTKRPAGVACCEPVVYPDVERDQALRMAEVAKALGDPVRDRKSTRLNSSHANISYAVFCLK